MHRLQLISPLLSCFIVFQFSGKVYVFINLFAFFQFQPVVRRNAIIIIIIIIIVHSLELFTSAIADGFSLESEWQQVSSSLQDSS